MGIEFLTISLCDISSQFGSETFSKRKPNKLWSIG
jgi:hypothetical protein